MRTNVFLKASGVPRSVSFSVLRWLIVVFIAVIGGSKLPAQVVGGTISGRITDATGASIPNAHVTVRNEDNGGQPATRQCAGTRRVYAAHVRRPLWRCGDAGTTADPLGLAGGSSTKRILLRQRYNSSQLRVSLSDNSLGPGHHENACLVDDRC